MFLASLVLGCKSSPKPLNDLSSPSAAVLHIGEISRTADEMELEIDVAVFRDSKHIEDALDEKSFSIDTIPHRFYFVNKNVKLVAGNGVKPYRVLMLMDQSSSIKNNDRQNFRLDAAKIFSGNLGQGGQAMLWSFPGQHKLINKHSETFTADSNLLIKQIDGLLGKEQGGTPLYESQDSALVTLANHAENIPKFLLTFTDGESNRQKQVEELIYRANELKIPFYNIALKKRAVLLQMEQAMKTDGLYLQAKEAPQLISFFGNLGNVLNKSASYYKTVWKVKPYKGLWSNRRQMLHSLKVNLPYSSQPIEVPFYFKD